MSQLCGIMGLIAAIGMAISDLVMLARPTSGREYVSLGLNNLVLISDGRLRLGATLGVLSAALYVPGFWHVYLGLESGGAQRALIVYWLLAASMVFGAVFHMGHGFIGVALRRESTSPAGSTAALIAGCLPMMRWMIKLSALTFVGGSGLFAWIIASGSSSYPNWFAIGSPAVFVTFFALLGWLTPAPWGGFLWPVCFNLAMIAFFAASMWIA